MQSCVELQHLRIVWSVCLGQPCRVSLFQCPLLLWQPGSQANKPLPSGQAWCGRLCSRDRCAVCVDRENACCDMQRGGERCSRGRLRDSDACCCAWHAGECCQHTVCKEGRVVGFWQGLHTCCAAQLLLLAWTAGWSAGGWGSSGWMGFLTSPLAHRWPHTTVGVLFTTDGGCRMVPAEASSSSSLMCFTMLHHSTTRCHCHCLLSRLVYCLQWYKCWGKGAVGSLGC